MESNLKAAAEQLHDWFGSVLHLAAESLFGMAPEGPHRAAVVLDVLRRNARILSESELDRAGKLYSPLCFFLAAACEEVGVSLGVGHWRAALDNVVRLERNAEGAREQSASVGLEIGSPAQRFKQEFDEAIRLASVIGRPSSLSMKLPSRVVFGPLAEGLFAKEDRRVALGLAVNWGMRFLLAYALECTPPTYSAGRRDLAWLAGLIRPLMDTSVTSA